MKLVTHKQRVLELLQDGRPHSHREGYALGVMLHSRVSDLRSDGHTIDQWRAGDTYYYQLTSLSDGTGTSQRAAFPPQPPSPVSSLSEPPTSNPDSGAQEHGHGTDGVGDGVGVLALFNLDEVAA